MIKKILTCWILVISIQALASDDTQNSDSQSEIVSDQDAFDDKVDIAGDTIIQIGEKFNWMTATYYTITAFLSNCIEIPQFPSMRQSSSSVELKSKPKWTSTGIRVDGNKTLQIEWSGSGISPKPRKYKVLYRIDPRFARSQVFIQKYSYDENKYLSDFHEYKGGILLDYQNTPEMDFASRIDDFDSYFRYIGRSKIYVHRQDAVNITLDYQRNFFSGSQLSNELGSLDELSVIYTESPMSDNRIIYSNANHFCKYGVGEEASQYGDNCASTGLYKDSVNNWYNFQGRLLNSNFNSSKTSMQPCADDVNGKNNDFLCYYNSGRGMNIDFSGSSIKGINEKFKFSPYTGKEFFYYRAGVSGYLDFTTFWEIEKMYNGYKQFMNDWPSDGDYFAFKSDIGNVSSNISTNFFHFGRYLMEIEIGNSESIVTKADLDNIKVEFIISDSIPADEDRGIIIGQNFRGNAPETGNLYLRVTRLDDNLDGSVNVKFANFIGSSFISDLIYGLLIEPLRTRFNNLTRLIYTSIAENEDLVNALRLMLVLYITIYALRFLAGAIEITAYDIVTRILKIAVVMMLFRETSWQFFNDNLFVVFTGGIDFLMSSVTGVTSNVGNPFGFIDPIFDRYTNPTIFALLLVQLLQINVGLILFAIIAIYALYLYLISLFSILIGYCVAFVGLAVMISLAPIFISFILFERTRSIFDNWISVMFNYLIEPTILLIFFLLIDQIFADVLLRTIARACWGILIPLNIYLDLNLIGIPLDFSFSLPFLPGIPFYIPEIVAVDNIEDLFIGGGTLARIASSSFLLFAISKLAKGMVSYVHQIAETLSNVQVESPSAAKGSGAAGSIMSDFKSITSKALAPVKSLASYGKNIVTDKIIGQKISSRNLPANIANATTDVGGGETQWKSATAGSDAQSIAGGDIKIGSHRATQWQPATPSTGAKKGGTAINVGGNRPAQSQPAAPDSAGQRNENANINSNNSDQWQRTVPKGMVDKAPKGSNIDADRSKNEPSAMNEAARSNNDNPDQSAWNKLAESSVLNQKSEILSAKNKTISTPADASISPEPKIVAKESGQKAMPPQKDAPKSQKPSNPQQKADNSLKKDKTPSSDKKTKNEAPKK